MGGTDGTVGAVALHGVGRIGPPFRKPRTSGESRAADDRVVP